MIESHCGILCSRCKYKDEVGCADDRAHFVTAFVKMAHGKICRLDEYYSDCGEAPDWRKTMKIGKPIDKIGGLYYA